MRGGGVEQLKATSWADARAGGSQPGVIPAISTRPAERLAVTHYLAAVVDSFTAFFAEHSGNWTARLVLGSQVDLDSFNGEQSVIRQELICIKLPGVLVLYFGKGGIGGISRRVSSHNPDCLSSLGIQECGCELSVVKVLEGPLSQPAARDGVDRVRGTTVDLDEHQQLLFVGAKRIIDSDCPAPQHRHSHAKHLTGTHMAVRLLGSN